MKIVTEVKAVREGILRGSGWLGGFPDRGRIEEEEEVTCFQNFSRKFCAGDFSSRSKLTFAILKAFQSAVSEMDNTSVLVPLVYLERYSIAEQTHPQKLPGGIPDIVKTELELGEPFSQDHEEDFEAYHQIDFLPLADDLTHSSGDSNMKTETYCDESPESSRQRFSHPFPKKRKSSRLTTKKRRGSKPGTKRSSNKTEPRSELTGPEPGEGLPRLLRISGNYHCETCGFKCRTICRFEQHLRQHETEDKSFHCDHDQCSHHQGYSTKQYYTLHQGWHNGSHKLYCDICRKPIKVFDLPSHLKTHVVWDNIIILPCPHCSTYSSSVEKQMSHIRDTHHDTEQGQVFKCELCEISSFQKKLELTQHLHEVHQAVEKFKCGVDGCDKSFFHPNSLRLHRNVHEGRYSCSQCGKKFPNQTNLDYHLKRHRGAPPKSYRCNQCREIFQTSSMLHSHKRLVHKATNHVCKICGEEYASSDGLLQHTRVKHEAGHKTCPICDKKAANNSKLRAHMERVHATGKNYVCEECGKAFRTMERYRIHKRIHTGEKRFQCSYCPLAFNQSSNLRTHNRIHSGVKPFPCDLCGKAFRQKGTMSTHRRKCPLLASSSQGGIGPGTGKCLLEPAAAVLTNIPAGPSVLL